MNLHRSTPRIPAASVRRATLVLAIISAAMGGGLALSLTASTGPAQLAPTPHDLHAGLACGWLGCHDDGARHGEAEGSARNTQQELVHGSLLGVETLLLRQRARRPG